MVMADELVAVVYGIGTRHRTSETVGVEREVYASELTDREDGDAIPDAAARAVYRQRVAARAQRRGGGG